jgi:hypothetical protein
MSLTEHLSAQRLAAYDDAPTMDELAHLAGCATCRQERAAYARLVAHAASEFAVDAEAPRLVEWEAIAAGLSAHVGVKRPGPAITPSAAEDVANDTKGASGIARGGWRRSVWRVVAAALLLATGASLERLSAPEFEAAREDAVTGVAGAAPAAPARAGFATIDEASDALGRAYRDYERAALWLAANDTTQREPDAVRARLAALDRMLAASRLGLREAPQDPVLNHYVLSAWAVREATLQQLSGVLPVGESIARY